jgi:hypothetical protein
VPRTYGALDADELVDALEGAGWIHSRRVHEAFLDIPRELLPHHAERDGFQAGQCARLAVVLEQRGRCEFGGAAVAGAERRAGEPVAERGTAR